jgi:hypothetical protein
MSSALLLRAFTLFMHPPEQGVLDSITPPSDHHPLSNADHIPMWHAGLHDIHPH